MRDNSLCDLFSSTHPLLWSYVSPMFSSIAVSATPLFLLCSSSPPLLFPLLLCLPGVSTLMSTIQWLLFCSSAPLIFWSSDPLILWSYDPMILWCSSCLQCLYRRKGWMKVDRYLFQSLSESGFWPLFEYFHVKSNLFYCIIRMSPSLKIDEVGNGGQTCFWGKQSGGFMQMVSQSGTNAVSLKIF